MNEIPTFKFALREDLKDEKRFLPTRGEPLASGWDVSAAPENKQDIIILPGQYFAIPLGFRSFCPPGWYYQLHPRSSSFIKKHMHNLIGIIDETWEGDTLFAGQYITNNSHELTIKFGEKIGQIIPVKRQDIMIETISNEDYNDLCTKRNSVRKSGGFGSTS